MTDQLMPRAMRSKHLLPSSLPSRLNQAESLCTSWGLYLRIKMVRPRGREGDCRWRFHPRAVTTE